jgi:hypothetical protein
MLATMRRVRSQRLSDGLLLMTSWKLTLAFVGVAIIVLLTTAVRDSRHEHIPCIQIGNAMPIGGDCNHE